MQTLPSQRYIPQKLKDTLNEIRSGLLGNPNDYEWLFQTLSPQNDQNLICEDFEGYLQAQFKIDQLWQNKEDWTKKSIVTALRVSVFSSDRTAEEYATKVWLDK